MSIDGTEVKFATLLAKRSLRIIFAAVALFVLLMVVERAYFQRVVVDAIAKQTKAQEIRGRLLLLDEILTNSARGYAFSADPSWQKRYDATVPLFDGALAEAKQFASAKSRVALDKETGWANSALIAFETHAFALAKAGRKSEAVNMIDGASYAKVKAKLAAGTDHFLSAVTADLKSEFAVAQKISLGILLVSGGLGALGMAFIWRRLNAALAKSESAYLNADADIRAKLASATEESVKALRMAQLGQLTATVAHEIRNPLGSIRTSAYLVERKLKDQNLGTEKAMERINNGIRRCDDIITELLDYSRNSSAKIEHADFDVWLTTVLEDTVQALPPAVAVTCILGLGQISVPFDQARLQRAVINLVNNASEAMVGKGDLMQTSGGAAAQITVETSLFENGIQLTVTDNGLGISEDNLKKIMQPLFTTKNFGTGLGLPAVQKIAEQHGGKLHFASTLGEGTCFTLWLPLEAAPQTDQDAVKDILIAA
jgi:signal transduction histidine kinase